MINQIESPQKIKQKLFLKAYKKNKYHIMKACAEIGVTRNSYYQWLKNDEFAAAVKNAQEELVDLVEACLIKQIENDNSTSTIFFLKCKAKNRGYIDSPQKEDKPADPVNWNEVGQAFVAAAEQISTKKPEE